MIAENILLSQELTWTDVENPLKGDLPFICGEFELPGLLVKDSLRPGHLPKFETSEDIHFFLLRIYNKADPGTELNSQRVTSKLAVFIHDNKVVTLHLRPLSSLRKFTELAGKPGFPTSPKDLVHHLFRLCVLSYEEAIAELQQDYEAFEKVVLAKVPGTLNNTMVYEFRRKLHIIKDIVQLIQQTVHHSRSFWGEQSSLHQDIKENLELLYFKLEGVRQNFDQLFALHLSINEQRNNDVMKVLTVFASVMLPLTFIASFYGMNFDHIPGLHTTTGFVGAIVIMATTTFITISYFARKKWLGSSM